MPSNTPSRKNDDITIKWDNSGSNDPISIELKGDCIFKWHKDGIADTGSYTIPKGDIDSTGGDHPETCNLTITVKRSRQGSADSHLDEESSFVLEQVRTTTFKSAP